VHDLLEATGVPRAFEVLYEQKVVDCHRAKRLLHQRLQQYRSTGNRELFAAIKVLEDVAGGSRRVVGANV
jgi:hypothetical protein